MAGEEAFTDEDGVEAGVLHQEDVVFSFHAAFGDGDDSVEHCCLQADGGLEVDDEVAEVTVVYLDDAFRLAM